MDHVSTFFKSLWKTVETKHEEGLYNTICLAVLLVLPTVILILALIICCHCCCCRQKTGSANIQSEKKKKKKNAEEDLWISANPKTMMLEKMPSLSA
ncbi:uncharacterized protein KIAA0040 homolog [Microcaecilia unicolor]|uniref:Uncharacterized protein KIAA0040 homolog n=1 Tax=Microcaecilia unicolor TaxID=1415580 RepID=A0A6P7Y931_9AMPH|nr:uncharacterized protein KIAA0040 homolog [Microcaecilia unicolor]